MTIQTLHPAPAQTASERYYPLPEVQNNAANAVTGADEAPGITAVEGKSSSAGENGIQGELMDRFAPDEPAVKAGLYRKGKGQDGNPTLLFDDPKKAEEKGDKAMTPAEQAAEEEKAAKEKKAAEEKEAEEKAETRTTTINTDRVDREIKELQEKIEDVSQELRTATGEQAEKLEQQLLLDKIELRLKDNDTYRRAHSQVSVE